MLYCLRQALPVVSLILSLVWPARAVWQNYGITEQGNHFKHTQFDSLKQGINNGRNRYDEAPHEDEAMALLVKTLALMRPFSPCALLNVQSWLRPAARHLCQRWKVDCFACAKYGIVWLLKDLSTLEMEASYSVGCEWMCYFVDDISLVTTRNAVSSILRHWATVMLVIFAVDSFVYIKRWVGLWGQSSMLARSHFN